VRTRQRFAFLLKAALLFTPDVVVTDVPLVPEELEEAEHRAGRRLQTERHVVLVPVGGVHDATIEAVRYAQTLQAAHTEALYFATETDEVTRIAEEWWEWRMPIPLTLVEAPFRDLGRPLLQEVRRYSMREDTVVTVVIPEFLVTKWWEHLLHGQTALFIKRMMLLEPHVVVTSVPYHLPARARTRTSTAS
jgi:hypothetical protein